MSSSSEVVKNPNEVNTQQQILLNNNNNDDESAVAANDSVLTSSIVTDNITTATTTNTSIAVPENDDSALSAPTSTTKNKKSSSSSISAEKRFDNCMFSTAKALIILSAIGFFTSGVLMLSAHNAAIVDYFYDEAFPEYVLPGRNGSHQRLVIGTTTAEPTPSTTITNSSSNNTSDDGTNSSTNAPIYGWYYRDSTTTIFFDAVICKNGHCHDLSTDIYVCPTMIKEIGQARDRSFYAGLLMLVGSGFTALALFARGFTNLINFLAHKTCKVCCSRSFHNEAYHLGNSSSEKDNHNDDDNTRTTNEETRGSGVDKETHAATSPENQKTKPMSLKQRKLLKKAAELEYVCCAPDSECAAIGKKVHDIFLILGVLLMVGLACFSIDVIVEVLDLVDKPLCPNHIVNGSVFSPYNVSLNSLSSFSFGRALHLTLGSAVMCLSIVGLFVLWFVSLVCSKGGCCRFSRSGKLIGCCCCCRLGKRDGNSDDDEDDYDDLVYQAFDAELRERESVEQMKALQQQHATTALTDNTDMINESLDSTTSSAASSSSSKRRKKVVVVGKKKKMSDQ